MIAHLRGTLEHVDQTHVIIEVNQIGYKVNVPSAVLSRLPAIGQPVKLFTLQVVREDDISLYGFLAKEEKALFSTLLSVSGVGPKLAMALISGFPLDQLVTAIAQGDTALLSSISGVGRKKADLIVVELREKIGKAYAIKPSDMALGVKGDGALVADSISALISLGYSPKEAREAIARLDLGKVKTVEEVIKTALKNLL
jgi:Holliday junction DNA helicase RuvA